MSQFNTSYISLKPTKSSRLSFSDARDLVSYISELSRKSFIELVIRSQNSRGLELFLGLDQANLKTAKKQVYSLIPDVIAKDVKASDVHIASPSQTLNFSLKKHYAYPVYDELKADSSALLKFMRNIVQLDKRESIEISLVAMPTQPMKSKMLRRHLLAGGQAPIATKGVLGLAGRSLIATTSTVSFIFDMANVNQGKKKSRSTSMANPRVVMILDKLYEPLFKASLKVNIKAASQKRAAVLTREIESALNNFAASMGHQQYIKRSQPSTDIYSASDLAAFFYLDESFVDSGIYDVEQLRTLPKLTERPAGSLPGDVAVGYNNYQGVKTDLALKQTDRQRHLYISGATGSGKSTLMANLIIQDINSGQGLTLIDPHGDLALDVLRHIPKNRLDDVIYFDPSDKDSQVTLNLLELKSKPGDKDYATEADLVTEGIISLFRKVFSEDGGHRIEYILRNTIQTSLTVPDCTIFTIYRLLTDRAYRFSVVSKLDNPDLINFWRNELGSAGSYQRVKMTAGVTAKIGRFLFSEPTKRVFGQSKSSLDISDVINGHKILICNFAKGNIGEDGSKLFATALLTKLQLAALSRVNTNPADRLAHYLYVDEFQTYAPSVLIHILSEARKYGLFLTMAEQSPSQQDMDSTSVILANTGNLLVFRTASPKDEQLLIQNFKDYLSPSDLNNLPAYSFYLKTTTDHVSAPTSGQTYPMPKPISHIEASLAKTKSRNRRRLITPHPKVYRAM